MDNSGSKQTQLISALIFAIGIALAGFFIGNSYLQARLANRFVTVKGSAEKEVVADLAIWPIVIKATGNNLIEVNNKIEADRDMVVNFLLKEGFKEEEISVGSFVVTDLLAQTYRNNVSEDFRYILSLNIILRTNNIELTQKATKNQSFLAQKGIVFSNSANSSNDYNGPFYEFTKFNDIKPLMLAEAIRNARISAESFARDSHNKLGLLKWANQGNFQIMPGDGEGDSDDYYGSSQSSKKSVKKKIRVVSTLEYLLDK